MSFSGCCGTTHKDRAINERSGASSPAPFVLPQPIISLAEFRRVSGEIESNPFFPATCAAEKTLLAERASKTAKPFPRRFARLKLAAKPPTSRRRNSFRRAFQLEGLPRGRRPRGNTSIFRRRRKTRRVSGAHAVSKAEPCPAASRKIGKGADKIRAHDFPRTYFRYLSNHASISSIRRMRLFGRPVRLRS